MTELRRDPLTGRWVVIAPGRAARPNDHARAPPTAPTDADCPFCEGHEARTPPESAAERPPGGRANGPGWTLRAIPNRFPTVEGEPTPGRPRAELFTSHPGEGVHEVVIESPRHAPGLPDLPAPERRALFRFLRARDAALAARRGMQSVLLFENWGPESGGSLWHPHAQLVGLPFVPPRLAEERDRFVPAASTGCPLEEIVASERRAGARWVTEDDRFSVFAPFASEFPYETWIVPRRHAPSIAVASDAEVDALAELLPAVLRALRTVVPAVSYNWYVHGLDAPAEGAPSFHWHVEVAPRLARGDGFDLGAGIPVNPVAPESAASGIAAALVTPPKSRGRKR